MVVGAGTWGLAVDGSGEGEPVGDVDGVEVVEGIGRKIDPIGGIFGRPFGSSGCVCGC